MKIAKKFLRAGVQRNVFDEEFKACFERDFFITDDSCREGGGVGKFVFHVAMLEVSCCI